MPGAVTRAGSFLDPLAGDVLLAVDYGVGAVHGRADGGGVQDVGGDGPQPVAGGDGQAGRVADDRGDFFTGRQRLLDEACPGGAGGGERW
jgi:hypothetical protein